MQRFFRHPAVLLVSAYIVGIVIGAFLTFPGTSAIDDLLFLEHTTWVLNMYGLAEHTQAFPDFIAWYGPLWDMILGLITHYPLALLHDPVWVRHTLNFALLPFTLTAVGMLLRRNGVRTPTIMIVIGMLIGYIRWDGHALLNTRDFPFSCAFLLVTLLLWDIIRRHVNAKRHLSIATIIGMTLLAIIPPLLRIPAFLHTPLLIIGCIGYALLARRMSAVRRIGVAVTPIIVSAVALYALHPALRFFPPERWLQPFKLFGQWSIDFPYLLFGEPFSGHTTPWWYAPIWTFIGLHPVAFVALIIGLIAFMVRGAINSGRMKIRIKSWTLRPGLEHALLAVTLASWLLLVIMHSTLYDEDRHILFLYPPLLVTAGLSLRFLSDRLQYALATILIVCGVVTFGVWGKYAYIYASPFLADRDAGQFYGDYWGVCVNDIMAKLPEIAPNDTTMVMGGIKDIVNVELARYRESPLLRDARYDNYVTSLTPPETGSYLYLNINRLGAHQQVIDDIATGKTEEVLTTRLPLGEIGCVLARYPGN